MREIKRLEMFGKNNPNWKGKKGMSNTGSRNLDANNSIAREYMHKYGDKVLLPENDWILAMDKMWQIFHKVTRTYRKQTDKIVKKNKLLAKEIEEQKKWRRLEVDIRLL